MNDIEIDISFLNNFFEIPVLWNDNEFVYLYKVISRSGLSHGILNEIQKKGFNVHNVMLMTPIHNESYCQILLEKKK